MGLVKPVAAEGSLKDWLEGVMGARGTVHRARQAHYCVGGSAAAGDSVLLDLEEGAQVGEVMFFAASDETSFVCANLWLAEGANVFQKSERHVFCELGCVQECLIFKKNSIDKIFVAPNTMWAAR